MTAVALLGAIYLAVSLGMRRARLLERAAYHEAQAARYYDARPDATALGLFHDAAPIPALSTSADEDDPEISFDGLELYFSHAIAASQEDIWVSVRSSIDEPWPPPSVKNMSGKDFGGRP